MRRSSVLALAALTTASPAIARVPVCSVDVVREYPHDATAFTQGLLIADGLLYESTGREGQSRILARTLEDAKPIRQARIDGKHFGEGLVDWGDELISLTWRDGIGYRWDRQTLKPKGRFALTGEGWGMTRHGDTIYLSDGSATLQKRDPRTMAVTGTLAVTAEGQPVGHLNELEWVDGEIWANVWLTPVIVRIDPANGVVKSALDLSPLVARQQSRDPDAVANGIAYDAKAKRLFVTGKTWTRLFEIRVGPCKA